MTRYDKRQTAITFAQRVAREHGKDISRDEAGWVVWNETGWPSFFEGDLWETFDVQLSEFFARLEPA